MCGICGVWGPGGADAVARMVDALYHRGPDDHGIYQDDRLALGMTRLAIIDVSPAGHQPMATPDGQIIIIYNGEVYNFASERALLEARGCTFRSRSDTEVVLTMYEQYGDDFVARLRGMFALAIYDRRRGPGRERLLLARDHLGIKPLLYAQVRGRLVFASELKALLAGGLVAPEIAPEGLRTLLTFGSVYQPETLIAGVLALLPGHRLICEDGQVRSERYWQPGLDRVAGLRGESHKAQVDALADALDESVRLQMVSDVPLGAFLSGGVDSSVITALLARHASGRVKTYSVGFAAEGGEIDESGAAAVTARFLGTQHTHVLVEGHEVAARIRDIARGLDQPTVDGVNSYFVSRTARQGVTVALSGTGGDELFAGYPWFADMAAWQHAMLSGGAGRPAAWLAAAARWPRLDSLMLSRGAGRLYRLRTSGSFVAAYAQRYQIFGALGAAELLAAPLRRPARAGRAEYWDAAPLDDLPLGSTVERVAALCLRGYTANQLLRDIDAASMAHSLEVRVPYLDWPLLDLALSLPDATKLGPVNPRLNSRRGAVGGASALTYRESGAKRILVEVASRLLPAGLDLQPKRGFAMPFAAWLQGPLADVLVDCLSRSSLSARGWIDPDVGQAVRDRFLTGQTSWGRPWLLMMLELWAREVLDPARLRQPAGAPI